MNGIVDADGRALLAIEISRNDSAPTVVIDAWIDTGFNAALILPQEMVDDLELQYVGSVVATLAHGKPTMLEIYRCCVEWFGKRQWMRAVASSIEYPLMGVGLLEDRKLTIDYRTRVVSVE